MALFTVKSALISGICVIAVWWYFAADVAWGARGFYDWAESLQVGCDVSDTRIIFQGGVPKSFPSSTLEPRGFACDISRRCGGGIVSISIDAFFETSSAVLMWSTMRFKALLNPRESYGYIIMWVIAILIVNASPKKVLKVITTKVKRNHNQQHIDDITVYRLAGKTACGCTIGGCNILNDDGSLNRSCGCVRNGRGACDDACVCGDECKNV